MPLAPVGMGRQYWISFFRLIRRHTLNPNRCSAAELKRSPDPREVDDRGAVNPEETGGVEPGLELLQRLADQVGTSAGVDPDAVVGGLDPVHVVHPDEKERPASAR